MSLGWLQSFFRAPIAGRTLLRFPWLSTWRAALDCRKWKYSCFCMSVSSQHTMEMSFGGRCLDSRSLVLLNMNSLTILLSSSDRSLPSSFTASGASGSRPCKIGFSNFLRNCEAVPNTPGLVKFTMAKNSSRLFCMGVPESSTLRRHCSEFSDLFVAVWSFLRRWASSQISRSQASGFVNFSQWIRKVSYDKISTSYTLRGPRKVLMDMITSSRLASLSGKHLTLFLSHFSSSAAQLFTRLVGQTMTALFTTGRPPSEGDPCLSSVHSRVMPWRVLPSPMSSARMQPRPSNPRSPVTHSNMN
mmetsp:Transcript_4896/g.13729  ORF Transcript_4896/g.13729 Transcript_4896/m.13729 type:complete len:302 (-) Transcript_4896:715-1620(-)